MTTKILFAMLFLSLFAAAPEEKAGDLKAYFPKVEDLHPEMTQEPYAEFDRGSLFDYINGGAEVYLDLDFVKVGAKEYVVQLKEETYFTLDIYDMVEPINAFGIYAAERYGQKPDIGLGVSGYLSGGSLYFWTRNYYVKIRADDDGKAVDDILIKMGRAVNTLIGEPGKPPAALDLFPEPYRVQDSEKYTKGSLMGFSFLKGFTCLYKNKEAELKLYLGLYASEKEAQEAEGDLVKKMRPAPRPSADGVGFSFDSKYQGKGRFARAGRYLAVAQGFTGKEKSDEWMNGVLEGFIKRLSDAALEEKVKKSLEGALKGLDGHDR